MSNYDVTSYQERGQWYYQILQLPDGEPRAGTSTVYFDSHIGGAKGYASKEEALQAGLAHKMRLTRAACYKDRRLRFTSYQLKEGGWIPQVHIDTDTGASMHTMPLSGRTPSPTQVDADLYAYALAKDFIDKQ